MLKKEILIIGGYGFLGLNIVYHFHNYFELTIAVKKSSIKPEINLPLKYKIVYTDNDVFFSILKVKQFDVIINCSVDYGSKSDCNQVFETDVNFPLRIIKCIEKSKTLFICFDTFYTKFQNYNYLKNYINSKIEVKNGCILTRNTKIINIQVDHLYGNFDSPSKFISFVIKNLKSNSEINLTQCNQKRDFIHVNDIINLIKVLVNLEIQKKYFHFEIGTGESISIKRFINTAKKIFKSSSRLNYGALEMRENEILDSYASLSQITSFCDWTPRIKYKEGLTILYNEQ